MTPAPSNATIFVLARIGVDAGPLTRSLAPGGATAASIAVHDLASAAGELWIAATAFSCPSTLDTDHSFVPRWTPSWITQLVPEDRCHLNGLAVVDDRVGS